MKVFVAGATGALGKQLVPLLVANGHDVVGMTRTETKRDQLLRICAQPVVADALDARAVGRAVGEAEPEVIVHQLTALSGKIRLRDARHPDRTPMTKLDTPVHSWTVGSGRRFGNTG